MLKSVAWCGLILATIALIGGAGGRSWRAPSEKAPLPQPMASAPLRPQTRTLSTASARIDPAAKWRAVAARPASITRDAELAETLEELALRDPDLAGDMLRSLAEEDRRAVVAAILLDAAQRPERAVELAHEFCRSDPAGSTDHGYAVVWALAHASEFDAAIRFVEQQQLRPRESEDPSKWLDRLFSTWAQKQPEAAAALAACLPVGSLRDEAMRAVACAWFRRDPVALANFVLRQPEGAERTVLLGAFAAVD